MAKSSSERVIPPNVRQAILAGDTALLSQLGKIGARKSAQSKRTKKKMEDELWQEFCQQNLIPDPVWLKEQELSRPGWDDDYKP